MSTQNASSPSPTSLPSPRPTTIEGAEAVVGVAGEVVEEVAVETGILVVEAAEPGVVEVGGEDAVETGTVEIALKVTAPERVLVARNSLARSGRGLLSPMVVQIWVLEGREVLLQSRGPSLRLPLTPLRWGKDPCLVLSAA